MVRVERRCGMRRARSTDPTGGPQADAGQLCRHESGVPRVSISYWCEYNVALLAAYSWLLLKPGSIVALLERMPHSQEPLGP